jgi:hypothetical protein
MYGVPYGSAEGRVCVRGRGADTNFEADVRDKVRLGLQ